MFKLTAAGYQKKADRMKKHINPDKEHDFNRNPDQTGPLRNKIGHWHSTRFFALNSTLLGVGTD